jgi:hypothetical protein
MKIVKIWSRDAWLLCPQQHHDTPRHTTTALFVSNHKGIAAAQTFRLGRGDIELAMMLSLLAK